MDDDEIRIRPKRDPDAPMSSLDQLVHLKWLEFVTQLAGRQATRMPDFHALYKRKAELDRKLSDP